MLLDRLITKMFARGADTKKSTFPLIKGKRIQAHSGYRPDIPQVAEFQSTMEANLWRFYSQCCKGIIEIEYEPKYFRFPKGATKYNIYGYVPDFRLCDGTHTWYIEAKGYMDIYSAEKIRLFQKYYSGLKLYLVTPVEYNLIKKYYSHKILGWE